MLPPVRKRARSAISTRASSTKRGPIVSGSSRSRPISAALTRSPTSPAFVRTMAALQRQGVSGLFGFIVMSDFKQSDRSIIYLEQAGLSLPDESYYRDPKFKPIRDQFVAHVAKMLELAGISEPKEAAARVMAVETRLAKHHWDRVKSRDRTLTYNKMDRKALDELSPGFDWDTFFDELGAPSIDEVIVRQPDYFTAMSKELDRVAACRLEALAEVAGLARSRAALEQAVRRRGLRLLRPSLDRRSGESPALEAGRGRRGIGDRRGRRQALRRQAFPTRGQGPHERAGRQPDRGLPGRHRVTRMDEPGDPQAGAGQAGQVHPQDRLSRQVARLLDAGDRPRRPGRQRPPGQRLRNGQAARQARQAGRPDEWRMTPQTVNAYYNPTMNEIVFPAAILQPPFFDMTADDAVNYGAIGAVIGHEIGHGFDDQGSKFDGDGNMVNWWTDGRPSRVRETSQDADRAVQRLRAAQLPGQKVNGALTIGENIGDLGGLSIAYKAYQRSLHGREAPVIDGLTGDQRFFIGYAQAWRSKARDAEVARELAIDPHSPPEFRCNGVVRNLPEFYAAFGVKEGDKLWLPPDRRVRIW